MIKEGRREEDPGRVDQQGGVGVLAGQLLPDLLHLAPVRQVRRDAVGRAVLGQCLDRVVDLVAFLADDDGAAARGHDIGSRLPPHPAAAADDH
jgi:hypothetical protein